MANVTIIGGLVAPDKVQLQVTIEGPDCLEMTAMITEVFKDYEPTREEDLIVQEIEEHIKRSLKLAEDFSDRTCDSFREIPGVPDRCTNCGWHKDLH